MFILFYISDTYQAWHHFLHSVGCEFPHPNKMDRFTYVTETGRPKLMIESIFTIPAIVITVVCCIGFKLKPITGNELLPKKKMPILKSTQNLIDFKRTSVPR